ncbi:MAG TPA: exosortase H [Desulfobacterales bacterium]|nr:exosortase H [Desulfobacterales bacterium]
MHFRSSLSLRDIFANRLPEGRDSVTKRVVGRAGVLLIFLVKFILTCGLLYTLTNWISSSFHELINCLTATTVGLLLRVLGVNASVHDVFIWLDGFSVKIITECSAIFLVILFFSFVFAYPTSIRNKVVGLLFGIPALFLVNLLRISLILVVGARFSSLFQYAHVYTGQILMIFMVFSISLFWLRLVLLVPTKDSPFSFFIRFIASSSLPFLLWLYLHKRYVLAHLHAIGFLLSPFGYDLTLPANLDIYPVTFNTFNVVAFTALILATKSIDRRVKVKGLLAGLAVLSMVHFIFRLLESLFLTFGVASAFGPFVAFIIINEWILPFVLWLIIVNKDIFRKKGILTCPFCRSEKTGIVQHIVARRGKEALLP